MQSYISKPVAPVKVKAVQYVAPSGDQAGNLDEVNEVTPVRKQVPWNPDQGQNCILADLGHSEAVMVPGAYLVEHGDGHLEVVEPEDFHATFDRVSDAETVVVPAGTAKPTD